MLTYMTAHSGFHDYAYQKIPEWLNMSLILWPWQSNHSLLGPARWIVVFRHLSLGMTTDVLSFVETPATTPQFSQNQPHD